MQQRFEELAEALVEKPGYADTYAVMGRLLNYARQCIATSLKAREVEELAREVEELREMLEGRRKWG